MLGAPPLSGSWTHTGVRSGFEVAFFGQSDAGPWLRGHTSARERGSVWSVSYRVDLAGDWSTRRVRVRNATATGERERSLARTPAGRWTVDGVPRPDLEGCVDVDLESSAVTNTLPVHRIPFALGAPVQVPAAFVRADDLEVERIHQTYELLDVTPDGLRFSYASVTFEFECELTFDAAGLVLEYPGIATRDS